MRVPDGVRLARAVCDEMDVDKKAKKAKRKRPRRSASRGLRSEARGRRVIRKARVGPLGLVLGLGPEEEEGGPEAAVEMVLRPQEEQ